MFSMQLDAISQISRNLETLLPIEYAYGSKSSLWLCGLNTGLVTQEQFNKARDYYGSLWSYVGD